MAEQNVTKTGRRFRAYHRGRFSQIGIYFSSLGYSGESGEYLTLSNIPHDFSGWGSYCRFSNSAGSADSGTAACSPA